MKKLKLRLISIAKTAAVKTGPIDEASLHARIEAGREEYHNTNSDLQKPTKL